MPFLCLHCAFFCAFFVPTLCLLLCLLCAYFVPTLCLICAYFLPNLCLLSAYFLPILCRFCVDFVSILWWAFCMDLRIFCFWVEKLGRLSQFIPLHLTLTVSMRFYDCLATKSSSFGTVSIYRWWQKCTVLQNTMVNVELVEILNMIHFCSNYARLPGVPGGLFAISNCLFFCKPCLFLLFLALPASYSTIFDRRLHTLHNGGASQPTWSRFSNINDNDNCTRTVSRSR